MKAKKSIKKKRKKDRRKKTRSIHIIDENTSYRDELLAHVELVDFFTKRY